MDKQNRFGNIIYQVLTYILVAAVASGVTYYVLGMQGGSSKLTQLEQLLEHYFIGETDKAAMEEGAAAGMVDALGDQWSYYLSADSYAAYTERMQNAYVGIGVSITTTDSGDGFQVLGIDPGSGAAEADIQIDDVIVAVEGTSVAELGMDESRNRIRGEVGSYVTITVLRDGQQMDLSVQRKLIQITVAEGQMLDNEIGLVTINNFDERCADETLAIVQELLQAGAKKLIFDVRFNPGGYKVELVKILDRLLPEGPLFRSESYTGAVTVDESDETCLKMPMAVLVNGNSYSAAEFFAAALQEYEWAVVVGEPTGGKGYFQNTYELEDGSAVVLSSGKYSTPNGVNLAEAGGVQPDVQVEVDNETLAKIYSGKLSPEEDPQIQAAIDALK